MDNNNYNNQNSNMNNRNNSNGNNNNQNGNNGGNNNNNKKSAIVFIIVGILSLLMLTMFSELLESATSEQISYDKFLEMLDDGKVEKVEISNSGKITITPKSENGNDSSDDKKTGRGNVTFTYWTTGLSYDELHK